MGHRVECQMSVGLPLVSLTIFQKQGMDSIPEDNVVGDMIWRSAGVYSTTAIKQSTLSQKKCGLRDRP